MAIRMVSDCFSVSNWPAMVIFASDISHLRDCERAKILSGAPGIHLISRLRREGHSLRAPRLRARGRKATRTPGAPRSPTNLLEGRPGTPHRWPRARQERAHGPR